MRRLALASIVALSMLAAGCVVRTVNSPPPQPPPPSRTAAHHGTVVTPAQPAEPPPPVVQPVPPGGLRGNLRMQAACTRMACSAANQCCNTCNLSVFLMPTEGELVGREVTLVGHSCRVDGCGQVTHCDLVDGALYTFPAVDVKCRKDVCTGTVR